MPSLGADMDEGTLLEWLVRPGAPVRRGEVVAVVETAKSTIEVECFTSGTIEQLLVDPGTTVPVGTPLAVIAAEKSARKVVPAAPSPSAPAPAPEPPRQHKSAAAHKPPRPKKATTTATPLVRRLAEEDRVDLAAVHGSGPGGRITRSDVEQAAAAPRHVRASPLARRLAQELSVDLARVSGTGKDGTVRADDVRHAAALLTREPAPPEAAKPVVAALSGADKAAAMRRSIGDLMSRSKQEIPHYYLSAIIDMTAALDWMRARNRRSAVGERLVPAVLLLKATALAARRIGDLNGFWQEDRFEPGPGVHLGVAVALRGGGLVAPALHDTDTLPLPELMVRLKDLVARARAGRLRGSETTDPTLTVTSLGDQGAETVFGVIYPPQVALVGFGQVTDRPAAVNGLLGVRPQVTATLSADHRASDGALGARFLTALDRLLQQPEEL